LFLVLLYQRQGPYRLIWPLLHLKPPRLTKARTKTMPGNQKRRLAHRYRLLPLLLKRLVSHKKRKRVDEIASSSSAAVGKAPVIVEDVEYFNMLAS
jgi:hypothetical protein